MNKKWLSTIKVIWGIVVTITSLAIAWGQFNLAKEVNKLKDRSRVAIIELLPYGDKNPFFHKYHLKNVGNIGANYVSMTVEVFKINRTTKSKQSIYKEPSNFGSLPPSTEHYNLITDPPYSKNFSVDFIKEDLYEKAKICYSQEESKSFYIYNYKIQYHPNLRKWMGGIADKEFSAKRCPE